MKLFMVLRYIFTEKSNKQQQLRRLLYAIVWQIWKRIIKKPVVITLDNNSKYIAYPNTPMGSFPIYTRVYDSDKILFLREFLKDEGIFIDIGANMGIYSLLLKDNFKKVILFEPIKETSGICEANMNLNIINYKMYKIALGNEIGKVKFDFKGNYDTTAKMNKNKGNYVVEINKLDNVIDESQYNDLEFVKIDVEGFELDVLKGAERIIKESSIRLIQFERLKSTPIKPLLEFFEDKKWKVFALDNDGKPSYDKELINSSHDLFAVRDTF